VENLRMPPFQKSELVDPWSAEANIGVPVRPFPRWMRCVKCGLLSPFDAGLFEIKENRFRPSDPVRPQSCRGSRAINPRRTRCRTGTFPAGLSRWSPRRLPVALLRPRWQRFVQGHAALLRERRFVADREPVGEVRCLRRIAQHGARLRQGREGKPAELPRQASPSRSFRRECDEEARAVLLGSTNSWFPITLSALAIPQAKDPLGQLIQDGWEFFEDLDSEASVAVTVKALKKTGALPGIDKYPASAIWSAIEAHRLGGEQEVVGEADIKGPEWEVLTAANPPADYPHFIARRSSRPRASSSASAGYCCWSGSARSTPCWASPAWRLPKKRAIRMSVLRWRGSHAASRTGFPPIRFMARASSFSSTRCAPDVGGARRRKTCGSGAQCWPPRMAKFAPPRSQRGLSRHPVRHASHALAPAHPRTGTRMRLQRGEHP